MPATDQTWYNMKRLHKAFAVSGVALFLSTLLMFAIDHSREWKPIQRTSDRIEIQMTRWRKLQAETDANAMVRRELEQQLSTVRSTPLAPRILEEFQSVVSAEAKRLDKPAPSFTAVDQLNTRLRNAATDAATRRADWEELADKAEKARREASEAAEAAAEAERDEAEDVDSLMQTAGELETAAKDAEAKAQEAEKAKLSIEQDVAPYREALLKAIDAFIVEARFHEDEALRKRKFESANLDAKKADLGIAIRGSSSESAIRKIQVRVDALKASVAEKTDTYQRAAVHRKLLAEIYVRLTQNEAVLAEQLDDALAESARLEKVVSDTQSNYFDFYGILPLPGKRWLELPIFDAFNSPRKIENLWSDDLDLQYGSFGRVRRFDRCTTCHQAIDKALPGTSDQPAYVESTTIDLMIPLPEERPEGLLEIERSDLSENERPAARLRTVFGLSLSENGLLKKGDVTVTRVRPESPVARARETGTGVEGVIGDTLRKSLLRSDSEMTSGHSVPGLRVGDVFVSVDDQMLPGNGALRSVMEQLLDAAEKNWAVIDDDDDPLPPVRLTIRRGLPNPYASHPRLDLFVGSMSPHKLADFACTVCHEGQGSATAFKYASHSPNDPAAERAWAEKHGWFDNHHWPYPMFPRRFTESGCLKCHHEIVELEPSQRFPDAPAPDVTEGYRLIRSFGCFGCHEMNGYDGPDRRIGPDLRVEPNYYSAAQQFRGVEGSGYESLSDHEKQWIDELIADPQNDAARQRVEALWQEDVRLAAIAKRTENGEEVSGTLEDDEDGEPRFSPEVRDRLLPLLKAQEAPGRFRKVGPSLRFVAHKIDPAFMYDWIWKPSHFRPSTRMPQFFGLWDHLPGQQLRQRKDALQQQLTRANSETSDEQAVDVEILKREMAEIDEQLQSVDEIEHRFEPVEVLSIIEYLRARTQPFDYLKAPDGVTPITSDEQKTAQIERGKIAFQEQGCLACHAHKEFPDIESFRDDGWIAQGPDLSELASKFAPNRNSQGPRWLYSWIKNPKRYHARSKMPAMILDPVTHTDTEGSVTMITDPAADIVAYLLSVEAESWTPVGTQMDQQNRTALAELALLHLKDSFPASLAEQYLEQGISEEQRQQLKGAERELIVTEQEREDLTEELLDQKRMMYVARKAFVNHGCFACHDIPGFEDAKPIGTGLADWGRKDPTRLAFMNIMNYVGHGNGGHGNDSDPAHDSGAGAHTGQSVPVAGPRSRNMPDYYRRQLAGGSRIGFIYQKLTEPRSYDYRDTRNKRYSERLRMPQFPLTPEQREKVITFVLGLVADPPRAKYVYQPDPRQKSIMEGKRVLARFNCQGCHLLEPERWDVAFEPDWFGSQDGQTTYPVVREHFPRADREASAKIDRRGLRVSHLAGMPVLANDGWPRLFDEEEFPLDEDAESEFDPNLLLYALDLWRPALIDGSTYQVGEFPLLISADQIENRRRSLGGVLAKYLLPHVVQRELENNPNAKGAESWAWVPPPLLDEGNKVQPNWLHDFLLDPFPIRPAVVLRMPRFNLSTQEATSLVEYFAATDRAEYPYKFNSKRRLAQLQTADTAYARRVKQLASEGKWKLEGPADGRYLADAMRIVTSNNYCVKCHSVGDFAPTGSARAQAPNLAHVYSRLRAEYVRRWIAKPTSIHPYTAMPVNIPYDPDAPFMGSTVPQDLLPGTSLQQLEALVDLLMNYDHYSQQRSLITPLVKESTGGAPENGTDPDTAGIPSSNPP